jgi:hypothetical protein
MSREDKNMEISRGLLRFLNTCFAASSLFCGISQIIAADITLAWEPSTSPNILGYELYIGNASKTYNTSLMLANQTTCTVTGIGNGTWFFAVKAFDVAGNESKFSNEVKVVVPAGTKGPPAPVFPRFSAGQNVLGLDAMVGMGLVNLDSDPTSITFTAFDDDGSHTAGLDFVNPMQVDLKAKEQLPIVDSQVFGNGIRDLNSSGYIKLDSTKENTSGLFLIFDSNLNFQDGATFSNTQLTDFAFSEIQTDGYNRISIINGNPEDADLTIDLVGADGGIRSSITQVISANGSLTADLFGDLFIGIQPLASDYIRVRSSIGVQSFQVMRQGSGDMAMLEGQDLTAGGTTLYSPLYAVGERNRTSFSVINLDSVPGTVSLRLFNQSGIQMGESREVDIPANGKIYMDDPGFFADLDLNMLNTGYLEIAGNGIKIIGSAVFGDINRRSFYAALALISCLQKSVLYSHVASNEVYFTGICILNPTWAPALVRLELYASDGTLRESKSFFLGERQRQSRLLSEYFTALTNQNQTSGYVRLVSDRPIASHAAFGTHNLSMISAIPPQIIR